MRNWLCKSVYIALVVGFILVQLATGGRSIWGVVLLCAAQLWRAVCTLLAWRRQWYAPASPCPASPGFRSRRTGALLRGQCRTVLLVKTSNPSSGELQDLIAGDRQIYQAMGDLNQRIAKDTVGKYGYICHAHMIPREELTIAP